jgi:hypothetical protein
MLDANVARCEARNVAVRRASIGLLFLCFVLALALLLPACGDDDHHRRQPMAEPVTKLSDLSGLDWLGGNTFIAVHDAKNPKELDWPRVSILTLTGTPEGVLFETMPLSWPAPRGASSDLESVAAIPGTDDVLLVESGDDGDEEFHRIFLVRWMNDSLAIVEHADWPLDIFNVEATAVASTGDGFVFVFAERADGEMSTDIQWAVFDPDELVFGPFSSIPFPSPDPMQSSRPLVGMDFDSDGNLYTVSAFDPDDDNGPFTSAVWKVGRVETNGAMANVVLDAEPELLGRLDGFKTEAVTIREIGGAVEVWAGTDDENFGGLLRLLP